MLSTLSTTKYPIFSLKLTMPIFGVWIAEIESDTNGISLTGKTVLNLGSNTLNGTIRNGSIVNGRFHCQLIGGNGKLSTIIPAKFYQNSPMILPIRETISEANEVIYPGAATDPLFLKNIPKWIRPKDRAGNILGEICDKMGILYHVNIDGSIFVGLPKWEEFAPKSNTYTLLMNDLPLDNAQEYAFDNDLIVPGFAFGGKKVVKVIHKLQNNKFRTTVIYGE